MSQDTDTTASASEPTAEVGADLADETVPREPAPLGARAGAVATLRWGWRQLTSMRTALVLLFLLALAAIPGSLLPQRSANDGQVAQYFLQHPDLAPVLDRVGGFAVFSSPWFAAIYLLLFVSLVGCLVPRTRAHLKAVRARPPKAPRRLDRLPFTARFEVDGDPGEVTAAAYALLRRRRFRSDLATGDGADGAGGDHSVAAEKGYARETGNLAFHLALLALLIAVAAGALFGWKGNVIVTEGDGFANTVIAYDSFQQGRLFREQSLSPFTVHLQRYAVDYVTSGDEQGSPERFDAYLRYTERPGGPERSYDLRVNHPLALGGSKVYLLGHGYAPVFTVRDGKGRVVSSGATPFVVGDTRTFQSQGVLKVPAADPDLGFQMVFLPTARMSAQGPVSVFPAPVNPVVLLIPYEGDLAGRSGAAAPQSVFSLDTSEMKPLAIPLKDRALAPGRTVQLPGGRGSIRFDGLKQYAALQTVHDPGKGLALGSAIVAIGALMLSLFVRRRRVWVRAAAAGDGRTVVDVGGLTRGDGTGGFTTEFTELVAHLRAELGAEPEPDPEAESDVEPESDPEPAADEETTR